MVFPESQKNKKYYILKINPKNSKVHNMYFFVFIKYSKTLFISIVYSIKLLFNTIICTEINVKTTNGTNTFYIFNIKLM